MEKLYVDDKNRIKLSQEEVQEIQALAVDGFIPWDKYIDKLREILNRN